MAFYLKGTNIVPALNVKLTLSDDIDDNQVDVFGETGDYDDVLVSFLQEEDGNGKLKNVIYLNRDYLKNLGIIVKNM